jgi:hypothetical protein
MLSIYVVFGRTHRHVVVDIDFFGIRGLRMQEDNEDRSREGLL